MNAGDIMAELDRCILTVRSNRQMCYDHEIRRDLTSMMEGLKMFRRHVRSENFGRKMADKGGRHD